MTAAPRIQIALQHCQFTARGFAPLSPRERQVLARLAEGDTYKEIADQLGIRVQTVNDHVKNVYRKLGVHSRTHAANLYLKWIH